MSEKLSLDIFGCVYSGKTTVTNYLKTIFGNNCAYIGTGAIFREEVELKTPLGLEAKPYLDKRILPPDELAIAIFKEALEKRKDVPILLFDGFPRTIVQIEPFLELVKNRLNFGLYLEVSKEELFRRMETRAASKDAREEDNPEDFEIRYNVFEKQTLPIVEELPKRKYSLIKKDANQSSLLAAKSFLADIEPFIRSYRII